MTAKITLTWDNGSSEHVDQIVYRSTETFTVDNLPPILVRVGRNAREYIDTDIVTGNVYFYAVASENAAEEVLLSSVISVTAGGDSHWSSVVSLLPFDEDFADEADKVWSSGGAPSINNTTYKFGTGSGFFNGVSYIESQASVDWAFGVGDFTVECWVYATAMPTGLYFSPTGNWISSTGGCFFLRPSGVISWHSGSSNYASANNIISVDTWYHISYSRESGMGRLFVDGIQVASGVDTTNFTWAQAFRIGNNRTTTDYWRGYVDELRITKGVARYTENFTPPDDPFPNY